jgi:hypothetical protein
MTIFHKITKSAKLVILLKKNAMAWLRQVKMTALLRPHHVQALRMLMGKKTLL